MHGCTNREPAQYFSFDAAYVDDLRNGKASTTEHFCKYFGRVIERSLSQRAASSIEDVRQETFLRVLRALKKPDAIQNPERLGAYVVSVAHYVLYELRRQQRRWTPGEYDVCPDTKPTPEVTARFSEMQHHLTRALATLSDRDRRLIALVMQEKSHDEISREMKVKKSSIAVMVHRARVRLREHFQDVTTTRHTCASPAARV